MHGSSATTFTLKKFKLFYFQEVVFQILGAARDGNPLQSNSNKLIKSICLLLFQKETKNKAKVYWLCRGGQERTYVFLVVAQKVIKRVSTKCELRKKFMYLQCYTASHGQ